MSVTPRTLEQMVWQPTAYEVVAQNAETTVRLAFTERRTKSALANYAIDNREILLPMAGPDYDGSDTTYSKADGWRFGAVRVFYSGQTERNCASAER